MDENRKAKLAFVGATILFLIETGLQVSGIANLPLAIGLWGIAALLFLYWLGHSVNDWRVSRGKPKFNLSRLQDATRRNLIPLMLGAIAVAGVLLLAVAISGAVFYRSGYFDQPPSEITVRTEAPKVTGAQPAQGPLIPNMPPALPAGMVDLVGRFIQLKDDLIPKTKATAEQFSMWTKMGRLRETASSKDRWRSAAS
jgi:hypothetical protein